MRKMLLALVRLDSKTLVFAGLTRCTLALGFLALCLGAGMALQPWLTDSSNAPLHWTVHVAVLLAAWLCGVGPAFLIAALGHPAITYLHEPDPLLSLALHFSVSTAIVVLVASLRRAFGKTNESERALIAAQAALQARGAEVKVVQEVLKRTVASVVTTEEKLKAAQTRLAVSEGRFRSLEEKLAATAERLIGAERAKAGAEEANKAKDRFIAVLSHELRTPLTPVLAAAQVMQRRLDEWRRPLDMICRNVQLEARLIDDLLELTRISQGKLTLVRKPTNINAIVERAVEICRPDIASRKLDFVLDLGPLQNRVDGDASRLQQVIWNLLANAVNFTPDGGRVALRCAREDHRVVIEVSDTGIGIAPEDAARIFDAFEQGGHETTRQFGGLGLGLAIAKRLVELHEGEISVYSEGKGRGASFRVSLPVLHGDFEEPAEMPDPIEAGPAKRILLVEDNSDAATTIAMLLESFGYEVQLASSVAEALRAIAAEHFDLLISDLGLPDRSGLELMQEVRGGGHALKGIALSGYGRHEDVLRSEGAGFSVHLTKPIDADGLVDTINRLLKPGATAGEIPAAA